MYPDVEPENPGDWNITADPAELVSKIANNPIEEKSSVTVPDTLILMCVLKFVATFGAVATTGAALLTRVAGELSTIVFWSLVTKQV